MRVLVVDPQPMIRDGVRAALSAESDIEVTAEAATAKEAMAAVRRRSPEVVVMAVGLPDGDGGAGTDTIGYNDIGNDWITLNPDPASPFAVVVDLSGATCPKLGGGYTGCALDDGYRNQDQIRGSRTSTVPFTSPAGSLWVFRTRSPAMRATTLSRAPRGQTCWMEV